MPMNEYEIKERKRMRNVWRSMRARCYSEKCSSYKYYGKLGVKMCAEWRQSFDSFLNDVGLRPSGDHSLDRKDSRGNYTKSNVRWATRIEQARNRDYTIVLTAFGETKTLQEWGVDKRCSVSVACVRTRLARGLSTEDAISKPKFLDAGLISAMGETKPLREWMRDPRCRVKRTTLLNRLHMYHWPADRAITQEV